MAGLDKLQKLKKLRRKHIAWTSALKNLLFEFDIYAYTPSLVVTRFSTWISMIVSYAVIGSFLFSVGYTSFLWMSTPYSISQGEVAHDPSSILLPHSLSDASMHLDMPKAGIILVLSNGTVINDSPLIKLTWEQATICSGKNVGKFEDSLATEVCTFERDDGGGISDTALCANWDASVTKLRALNNTARNPCGTNTEGLNYGYVVPRIAGTFYDAEYSYITGTVNVDAAALAKDPAFYTQLFKGSLRLVMVLPYTSGKALASGAFPDDGSFKYSKRVNLYPNVTMKWEVSLRVRQVSASSYWWDVPFLDSEAIDYSVMYSEVSMGFYVPQTTGYVTVARVYLRLDDRDLEVTLSPFTNLFNLFGDWGGFLSILMVFGIPAIIYNENVFRSTVTELMDNGRISFNENLRKRRSQAIHASFAIGLHHNRTNAVGMSSHDIRQLVSEAGAAAPEPLDPDHHAEPPESQAIEPRDSGASSGSGESGGTAGSSEISAGSRSSSHSSGTKTPRADAAFIGATDSGAGTDVGAGAVAGALVQQPSHGVFDAALPSQSSHDRQDSALLSSSSLFPSGPGTLKLSPLRSNKVLPEPTHEIASSALDGSASPEPQDLLATIGSGASATPGGTTRAAAVAPAAPAPAQPVGESLEGGAQASAPSAVRPKRVHINQPPPTDGASLDRHSVEKSAASSMLSAPTIKDMAALQATASILIDYERDIFEDSDEDENDFDDVIRHCTSECQALYHLRQVVKLVQAERRFLTCGAENVEMVRAISERSRPPNDYDVEALAAQDREASRVQSRSQLAQQQEQQEQRLQHRQQQVWQDRRRRRRQAPGSEGAEEIDKLSPLQTISVRNMLLPQQVPDGSQQQQMAGAAGASAGRSPSASRHGPGAGAAAPAAGGASVAPIAAPVPPSPVSLAAPAAEAVLPHELSP